MPSYLQWKKKLIENKNALIKSKFDLLGNTIFKNKLGFNYLRNCGSDHLLLEKPGYEWDDLYHTNVLKLYFPQDKLIEY